MADAIVRYKGKRKTHSWIRWLIARTMRKNQNNLISVVGKTGSGKTWSAISICEMMSKIDGVEFNIDHIVFSLRELMELINSGKLKKGSKIIFDEPQVSISSREFQSEANKIFNYLLSTFRHRNLTLFFCTPFETLLDKNARRLFHGRFETMGIDRNRNKCSIKPRYLEHTDFKKDPYRKQLIVGFKHNDRMKYVKVFDWSIPKPSSEMIEEYEKKKLKFTTQLNKNIEKRLIDYDDKGKGLTSEDKVEYVDRKALTPRQEEVVRVFANVNGSDKFKQASEKLGISMTAVHKNLRYIKKKGYKVEEFIENV